MNYLDGIPGLFHFLPCLAEKEGFGTLRNKCRLGGIQQVSTGHLHLIVQISPSYFRLFVFFGLCNKVIELLFVTYIKIIKNLRDFF